MDKMKKNAPTSPNHPQRSRMAAAPFSSISVSPSSLFRTVALRPSLTPSQSSSLPWPKLRRLLRPVASSSSSSVSSSEEELGFVSEEREQLKTQLLSLAASLEGSLDEACLGVISSLEKLSPHSDFRSHPELVKGTLAQVKGNFRDTKEKEKRVGFRGAPSELGRVTFNMLNPTNLSINLLDIYLHVGVETPDGYNFMNEFAAQDPESGDVLEGFIVNQARYTLVGPTRMDVEFLSCGVQPKYPNDQDQMMKWMKLFKDPNPTMDHRGCVVYPLPMQIKGWTDVLYLDDEIRVTRGNRGGVAVLKVLKEPLFAIQP